MKGIITKSTGAWYDVKDTTTGIFYKGRMRGKIRLVVEELQFTNPVAVGDCIEYEIENESENTVVITDIHERENYVIRQSSHKRGYDTHILAANVTQAMLIISLVQPRTSLGFIDRFLISTETFRIPTWLIFNKADLLDKKALAYQESVMQVYQNIGYRCLTTSTKTQEGIIDFKKQLLNQQTLIAGHSGVGKSSLINLVLPHLSLKTSEISNFSGKGVHTTTFAEMFDIDESSRLIDTPGIRELGIVDIAPEELSHYFPEMRALLGKCKYNTCTHLHEPNCAVLEALARGEIAESRYETYLTIMEGRDTRAKRK